ncbi:6854_t:CDS:1, partial [Dentiscutata heterogama]
NIAVLLLYWLNGLTFSTNMYYFYVLMDLSSTKLGSLLPFLI